MSSVQLATMSTALWVVATVSLFILLAGWSTGESWGLTSSLVRGVRSWAEHDRPSPTITSPFSDALAPLLVPRRPIGGAAAARLPSAGSSSAAAAPPGLEQQSTAEVIDFGEHHLCS